MDDSLPTLDALPHECILRVLSHACTMKRMLATVALVNRRFQQMSGDNALWKPLFERLSSPHLVARIERAHSANGARRRDQTTNDTAGSETRSSANPNTTQDIRGDNVAGRTDTAERDWNGRKNWKEWTRLLITTTVEMVAYRNEGRALFNGLRAYQNVRDAVQVLDWTFLVKTVPLRMVRTSCLLGNAAASIHMLALARTHTWLVAHDDGLVTTTFPDSCRCFVPLRLVFAHRATQPLKYDQDGCWWEPFWVRSLFSVMGAHDGVTHKATSGPLPNIVIYTVLATVYHRGDGEEMPMLTVPECAARLNSTLVDPDDQTTWRGVWYKLCPDGRLTLTHTASTCTC